ncbi:MAG: ABC transporter substrate-binding protein [Alphaproteobacteria bacterium]|nr:MAG: ABC transporter substrate-binding protein [Alphaproteobacteria bacterium]
MRLTGLVLAALLAMPASAPASEATAPQWRHGGTLFGELKYGPGFAHYEHVNPDAPKGGTLNQAALGSFDSFNPFIVRGRAAAGLAYSGGLLYDSLLAQSVDQPSAAYGLVAEAFRHADDFSSATYRISPRARFHDGTPITADDVIWSLQVLKDNNPLFKDYYHNVVKAEETGEREVTFTFDVKGNRELPLIMGDLPVLPRHWWEGTDAQGRKRDISEPISEPPLGSGPYRIARYDLGKSITWERVPDYWGAELGPQKGRYNFDRIRYTYFLDDNAIWEAFKKGGIADTRSENRSQRWATEYNFPAFGRGDVVKDIFKTTGPQPFQGYFFNTRLKKLADPRVRRALTLLFDFESMNRNLFYGLYTRTDSYFEGGELQAPPGPPQGREREILEEYRGRIADAVFDEAFTLPAYDKPADTRSHQREALRLFTEAGFSFRGGRMYDPDGRPFTIELLGSGPTDERVGIPTSEYFKKLGVDVSIRIVDTAQYKNRIDNFDFEVTMLVTAQSLSPGNEQREYWSSAAADRPGARNYAGIKDPVVDELVERIIRAGDRDELVVLTHALDRILLHGHYAIPMWHNPDDWFAWWRKLRFPPTQPLYTGIDLMSLWIDTDVEQAMERTR